MLCISRQKEEIITLLTSDGPITVKHIGYTDQGDVRLGIEAPKVVKIIRGELLPAGDAELKKTIRDFRSGRA